METLDIEEGVVLTYNDDRNKMEKIKLGPQTLLYPMPAVLIGANVNEKPNLMTAAWCGIASHEPPAVAVAVRKNRYTLEGIKKNETFS